ncbi:MAG: TetR/AcrR family transcriptional regulator [Erysipelotrichaceae bacterium]|nr:TetR/AcrR family transcriptional regulator [Erysipelotrichaceae bacterium]
MNKSESKYFNTALLMNEALLLLLETKDYEFITVTEICKKAGVNRSTFYLHYLSIDDLLYETLEMINKRFHNTFNNKTIDINKATKNSLFLINDDYLIPYLNFIKQNKKIYKLIHEKPYIFKKQITFEKMYEQLFSKILDIYQVPLDEQEYIFSYYSLGLVAVIQKWIEKDCIDDVNKIANIMKKVINYETK